jgi:hypothetical protein
VKKMNKKTKLLTVALATVVGLGLLGAKAVRANEEGRYPPIVYKLVERFNLNEGEVMEVFDETREERREQMQEMFLGKLGEAVENGKITAEQKEAILEKHKEMRIGKEDFFNLSPEEKREVMQEKHEKMETWAQENGLEDSDFFELGGQKSGIKRGVGTRFHKDF